MRDFNLQEFFRGAKVITRTGKKVENLYYHEGARFQRLSGLVDGELHIWFEDGTYSVNEEEDDLSFLDLMIADKDMYVIVLKHIEHHFTTGHIFDSIEDAESFFEDNKQINNSFGIFKLTRI